jgi:CheY-like chemotaxis protein
MQSSTTGYAQIGGVAGSNWEIHTMKNSSALARLETEHPPRILLAEDDDEFRGFLVDVLTDDGYVVESVSDGRALLDRVAEAISDGKGLEGIDLILSDIRMPHYDALDVVGAMHAAHITVPILLMTAFGARQTHERALRLGAQGVLNKPFEIDDLRTLLGWLLPDRMAAIRNEPSNLAQ